MASTAVANEVAAGAEKALASFSASAVAAVGAAAGAAAVVTGCSSYSC